VTDVAVSLRAVSKRFTLRHEGQSTLRDFVLRGFRNPRTREAFWAVRDVDLEIPRGVPYGIIGANGSGKSTLLKLIAGILRPTTGTVRTRGRVAALLELGAGFHPDLSGRENIHLNGSLLGMDRRSIARQLESIVAFAELERFVDMPLRHFSSGMTVRLGFAIAIHAQPDILIADEVLSVGDESFQRRCIDWVHQYVADGHSLILVSHSLSLIEAVCRQAIWMRGGRVAASGDAAAVIDRYHRSSLPQGEGGDSAGPRRWGTGEAVITSVRPIDDEGETIEHAVTGESLRIRIGYLASRRVESPQFGLALHASDGTHLAGPNSDLCNAPIAEIDGVGSVDVVLPRLPLLAGLYRLTVAIYDRHATVAYDHHDRAYELRVENGAIREIYGSVWLGAMWEHRPARRRVQSHPMRTAPSSGS